MRRELAELPGLYLRCESMLVRFPPALAQRVAGGGTTGLVLDEGVTSVRSDILCVLASWSGLVADERFVGRPGRDVGEMAAFLVRHLDWLLAHQAGACFAAELVGVAGFAREVCGSGSGAGRELGRCVEDGCEQVMVAGPGSSGSGSAGSAGSAGLEVRCGAGHAWGPRQWLRLARQIQDRDRLRGVPT